ncbi:MAG TPA: (2Fe-2S)-binding protein [Pseudolabrys sp.]|nr:(2Fe-2S)-binding protein [Pseudolabrys sp.]
MIDEPSTEIECVVNGESIRARVPFRQSLVDFLRHGLGLTGSHVGCEHGICGACHVVVDGRVVRGCLMLAVQVHGRVVSTIENSQPHRSVKALQESFYQRAALQCGFCTPGMILQAAELLQRNLAPTRGEIRDALSGNYCRCTGYQAIVDAVETAAQTLRLQEGETAVTDIGHLRDDNQTSLHS